MTANRIVRINAGSTALSAVAMLAGRSFLYPQFGLPGPLLLDSVAIGFLLYAAVMAFAAARLPVGRRALLAFAFIDAAWVVVSAMALVSFWPHFTIAGRALIVAVALVVELFAALQFRAAGVNRRRLTASLS